MTPPRAAFCRSAAVAAGSGFALSASFEPIAWPALLPLALAGFAVATTGLRVRAAAGVGLIFGVAFYFTHIAWMRTSIGPDAWAALATIEALAYAIVGLGMPLMRRLPAWPLWAAAWWTTVEGIRSTWPFSGMPWGRLSFAAVDTPVAAAVAYLGMTGLSFGLALLGFTLAAAFGPAGVTSATSAPARPVRRRASGMALLGVLAVLMVPAVAPYPVVTDPAKSRSAVVAAVQGDVPGPGNNILYDARGVTHNHTAATVALADDVAAGNEPAPDFVVWPENSTAVDPFADAEVNAAIRTAVAAVGVPILVGGIVDDGPEHVLNQGIVWDPVTGPGERYTKHHPVPYGEYIPFRDLWDPEFGQLALIRRDMRAGTGDAPLRIAGIAVGDAICFDVAYDDVLTAQVREGAELLTVQTSNASFIFTHQIDQQFAITRMRAIETGRWLVVASPNGRSGVIAPDGGVVATADPRTAAVLVERVGLSSGLTPAVRAGEWPGRLFIFVSFLGLVLGSLAYRRKGEDARSAATLLEEEDPARATDPTTSEAHGGSQQR